MQTDDAVRVDIRPHLQDHLYSVTYSVEMERRSKLSPVTKQKRVKVATVQEQEGSSEVV